MLLRLAGVLRRVVLRTERGPLRVVWAGLHHAAIYAVYAHVAAGLGPTMAYLKGGFGFGRPVYGLSDVDMVVVVGSDAGEGARAGARRALAKRRWAALRRRLPPIGELFQLWFYDEAELREIDHATYLTYGIDGSELSDRAAFLGDVAPADEMALLDHPGLFGAGADLRALGRRRSMKRPVVDPAQRATLAWLELRFIWSLGFQAAVEPHAPHVAFLCEKLIADSARVWLWLVHDEQLFDRRAVLDAALARLPEEEQALRMAADLDRRLPRSPPPPLGPALGFLLRISNRIAKWLAETTTVAAVTDVRLDRGDARELLISDAAKRELDALAEEQSVAVFPLADWRACAIPALPDEAFAVLKGDAADPEALRRAALASERDVYLGYRAGQLIVLPSASIWHRGRLRGIECRLSDPVSFALADGASHASFTDLPGWSARGLARRALAEHRGWLSDPRSWPTGVPYWAGVSDWRIESLTELGALFCAARAAVFAESFETGEPTLPLTAGAVAERLEDLAPQGRRAAADALEELGSCRPTERNPDRRVIERFRTVVRGLPGLCVPGAARA